MTDREQRLREIRERVTNCYSGKPITFYSWRPPSPEMKNDMEFLLAEIERLEAIIGEPMMDQIVNRSKPVGSWDFKPTIRVKEGTDLSKITDR